MSSPRGARADGAFYQLSRGVLFGVEFPKPASGLTATYSGGLVRVGGSLLIPKRQAVEFRVAGSTKLFTASKDTYVYANASGVLTYSEVANGAAKPTQTDIGEDSEFLWKVVTDGSNITTVTDLRQWSHRGRFHLYHLLVSFVTAAQGDPDIVIPYVGIVRALRAHVVSALSGTDNGTVTASINKQGTTTAITNGLIDIPLSSVNNVRVEAIPSALNQVSPDDRINLAVAKTTTGGEAIVEVLVEEIGD
jgi:hypothetical protein